MLTCLPASFRAPSEGVAIHLPDELLPDCEKGNCQIADAAPPNLDTGKVVATSHRIVAIAQRSFAEELRLAIIGIPSRSSSDPASHHVIATGDEISVVRRFGRKGTSQHFVAQFRRAALVRIQAENPLMTALRHCVIAEVAETAERRSATTRAPKPSAISTVLSLLPKYTTTISSAHSTLATASAIFSASLWARI